MSSTDRNCHPADAHRKRITRNKPCTMQRLDRNALVKAKLAQSSPVAFGQRGPVDHADRGFVAKWEVCKGHLRTIISSVDEMPAITPPGSAAAPRTAPNSIALVLNA